VLLAGAINSGLFGFSFETEKEISASALLPALSIATIFKVCLPGASLEEAVSNGTLISSSSRVTSSDSTPAIVSTALASMVKTPLYSFSASIFVLITGAVLSTFIVAVVSLSLSVALML